MTKSFTALAMSLAAMAATPAAAQDAEQHRTVIVHSGDLDLRKAADVRTLNTRIGWAVRHVCDVFPRTDMIPEMEYRCRTATAGKLAPIIDRTIAMANRATDLAMASSVPAH